MRKVCRRKVYKLLDPIAHAIAGAGITTADCLDQLITNEKAAIEAMRTGNATVYTWQELVDMNNICQVMARNGIGPEALVDCMMAEIELKHAAKRFEATGKMLLTGVGLKSINEVLEWHHLQRRSVSRSEYERMIQKTRNKLRSRSKDVTVIQ
jgi:D-arabinose 1-dehydrogenase-like Zn-dependent alcohol dehydrogenase